MSPAPARRPVLLLTGFEPFDGAAVNPSWELARALDGQAIGGARVRAVQLPCVFDTALPALQAALAAHRPRWVLALGLAGSRSAISVERVAINLIDARIPDNAGAQPVDVPVVAGGPPAYFTGLPAKALVARLQQAGHRAELSFSAGSFVCNQVFYGLMHALAAQAGVAGGFIHVPPLPDHADALDEPLRALRLAIAVVAADTAELAVAGGRVD